MQLPNTHYTPPPIKTALKMLRGEKSGTFQNLRRAYAKWRTATTDEQRGIYASHISDILQGAQARRRRSK